MKESIKYPLSSLILEQFPSLSTLIYGLPAWYWVSIFLALFIAFMSATFIRRPLAYLAAVLLRQKNKLDKHLFVENLIGPIHVFTALLIFLFLSTIIKEPEDNDSTISVAKSIAIFLSFTYLFYRLIDLVFSRLIRNNQSQRSRVALVLPLLRRAAKTMLIIIAVLLMLAHFGVDVSAFVVGLGVGSLAIALAAQKILENLFGGAVLSLDQPFQVGDYCKCGEILGYVEEIGIRSTRIRTLDRTLISIPNSKLSEMHIENYMEREKIRLYNIFRIDLATPLSNVKELLSEFERILHENDNFHHDIYRIRLLGMSDLGYEIEVYAFGKTTEWTVFVAMREELFFSYLETMQKLKIKFAAPVMTNFVQDARVLD
jgi:MscS family membrane protein